MNSKNTLADMLFPTPCQKTKSSFLYISFSYSQLLNKEGFLRTKMIHSYSVCHYNIKQESYIWCNIMKCSSLAKFKNYTNLHISILPLKSLNSRKMNNCQNITVLNWEMFINLYFINNWIPGIFKWSQIFSVLSYPKIF